MYADNLELFNENVKKYKDNNTLVKPSKNKFCFIHSCTLENTGTKMLNYMIDKILQNCIDIFEKIYIVNIGIELDPDEFKNDKIIVINFSEDINWFEFPTINLIRTFVDFVGHADILYLHTKGFNC